MKKNLFIIVLFFILFTLSSCWGKKELDELTLISALGIDASEEGYLLTIQAMNPAEIVGQTKTSTTPVKIFSEEGETIFQTIRKLTKQMPRKAYFPHLMVIVISEEVAKKGIFEVLDFLIRDPEIRPDVHFLISKNVKAKDVITQMTHIETVPANKIKKSMINVMENWSTTKVATLINLVNMMASDGINPSILGITVIGNIEEGEKQKSIEDNDPSANTIITNIAVFKSNQLIGWLNDEEQRGYSRLLGDVKSTIITTACDKNNYNNLEVTGFKNKTEVKVKNGKPFIKITHNVNANIGEIGCSVDLSKPEVIKKISKAFENQIKEESYRALDTLQNKYQSDIIGFGEMIHRQEPKLWKNLKDDWDTHFATLEVDIDAKVKIKRPGIIRDQLIEKFNLS